MHCNKLQATLDEIAEVTVTEKRAKVTFRGTKETQDINIIAQNNFT
jgi:hypothetical protein